MKAIANVPECFDCGEKFSQERKALGYEHCIKCGDTYAKAEMIRKSKCVAPAFNKGAYQYIGTFADAKQIGR